MRENLMVDREFVGEQLVEVRSNVVKTLRQTFQACELVGDALRERSDGRISNVTRINRRDER